MSFGVWRLGLIRLLRWRMICTSLHSKLSILHHTMCHHLTLIIRLSHRRCLSIPNFHSMHNIRIMIIQQVMSSLVTPPYFPIPITHHLYQNLLFVTFRSMLMLFAWTFVVYRMISLVSPHHLGAIQHAYHIAECPSSPSC